MEKIEIEVSRTDQYLIMVDPEVWNDQKIKEWASVFFQAKNTIDIARHLANSLLILGVNHGFIEGFGYVKIFNQKGYLIKQYKGNYTEPVSDDEYCEGIAVHLVSIEDYETEVLHPIV